MKGIPLTESETLLVRADCVGRQQELGELRGLLASAPLVNVVGPAGVGKSTLARRAAAEHTAAAGDAVLTIDLLDGRAAGHLNDLLLTLARERSPHLLVVLDNCDHAIPACLHFATAALGLFPAVRILATCRERIGATVESVFVLEPLRVPSPDAPLDVVMAAPSVSLFVDHCRRANPRFALTPTNINGVARLCREVDGLPLAIELAAARTVAFSVDWIANHIDEAIRLHPSHGSPSTDLSFSAALERTIDRLSEDEQQLLWKLAVFSDSWDVASAERLCGGPSHRSTVLARLARLVACSFVRKVDADRGLEGRYALLNTVRRYALYQLEATGQLREARDDHARFFGEWIASIPFGTGELETLGRLHREQGNIESALEWAVSASKTNLAMTLVEALHGVWYMQAEYARSRKWFDKVLAMRGGLNGARAHVMMWAINHAVATADIRAAVLRCRALLSLVAGIGDPAQRVLALDAFATLLAETGNVPRAAAVFENERALCDRYAIKWLGASVLYRLAALRLEQGSVCAAEELADRALTELGEDGNVWMQLRCLHVLSRTALARGDFGRAGTHAAAALRSARQIGDIRGTIDSLTIMAEIEFANANAQAARRLAGEALELASARGEALLLPRVLDVVVAIRALSRPEATLRLAGAVTALRQRTRIRRLPGEEARHQTAINTALRQLRPTTGHMAMLSGQPLAAAEVAALARDLLQVSEVDADYASIVASASSLGRLTPREAEIAALLARGMGNRAIGDALFISEGTVRSHVEHILSKLGVRSRVLVADRLTTHRKTQNRAPAPPVWQ